MQPTKEKETRNRRETLLLSFSALVFLAMLLTLIFQPTVPPTTHLTLTILAALGIIVSIATTIYMIRSKP